MENILSDVNQNGPCPRCGADASWVFADPERSQVQVSCPDCGRFEMERADFDQTRTEMAEPEER
jgi:hypothetical protein